MIIQDNEATKGTSALSSLGANVTDTMMVEFTPDARVLYESPPFSTDVAADVLPCNGLDCASSGCQTKGLLSRVSRVVAAKQAAILHSQLHSPARKVALLVVSGESGQAGMAR